MATDKKNDSTREDPPPSPNLTVREKIILEWQHYVYEFFIVALGISIPFLLDRWNQNIQDRASERQYYSNLQRELADDLDEILGTMEYNERYLQEYRYGSRIIQEADRNRIDTLGHIVYDLRYYSDFHRDSDLYETLVNSGELPLIRNRKIVSALQQLSEIYTYANRMENSHLMVIIDLMSKDLLSRIQLLPFQVKDSEWIYGYRCHNLLLVGISLCEEKAEVYRQAKDQILSIQSLLAEELR